MELLQKIDTIKVAGPDLILARILTSLFQQSYDSGLLPANLKTANVATIYKNGPKSDPKNYRPVSLTALTCKIMDHIICTHIVMSFPVFSRSQKFSVRSSCSRLYMLWRMSHASAWFTCTNVLYITLFYSVSFGLNVPV